MNKFVKILQYLLGALLAVMIFLYIGLIFKALRLPLDSLQDPSPLIVGQSLLLIVEMLGDIIQFYYFQLFVIGLTLLTLISIFIVDHQLVKKYRFSLPSASIIFGGGGMLFIYPLVKKILTPLLAYETATPGGLKKFVIEVQHILSSTLDHYIFAGIAIGIGFILAIVSMVILVFAIYRDAKK